MLARMALFRFIMIFHYLRIRGHQYSLGASDGDMALDNSPKQGTDITGDGKPNLLIFFKQGEEK